MKILKKVNPPVSRLRVETSLVGDSDTTSIEVLHPTEESTAQVQVDIVLVPGLGGHFIRTWQGTDKTVWPRDLLPGYLLKTDDKKTDEKVRVLSFRYNTSLNGTMSMIGITEHANDLLTWLYNNREDDESATLRPLIFVGHSLGGMVIKRALYMAAYGKQKFRGLWHASRGVMFFATPHLGLDEATWNDFARFVLQHDAPVKGAMPTRSMVRQLKANSENLLHITEDFKSLYSHLAFVTFIEAESMPGLKKVLVNGLFGKMHDGHERHEMLSGNHLTICQFTQEEGESFHPVWKGVKFLMRDRPNTMDELEDLAKRALYSLSSDKFHSYFLERPQTQGTGNWILERHKFQEWLRREPGKEKLWICGEAGCGKSFLTKHIITDIIPPEARHEVIYCFLSSMYSSRNSLKPLLQSTLHQALRLQPQLIKEFLQSTFEEAQKREQQNEVVWTAEGLMALWPEAMAKVIMEHQRPLTVIVDGLDEIKPNDQESFFQCLEDLERRLTQSQAPKLRFLFVSQQQSTIESRIESLRFDKYSIQSQDTEVDITRSIGTCLNHLFNTMAPGDEEVKTAVMREIKGDMVGDMYLRATLRSEELRRTRINDKSDMLEILNKIPDDTEELCDHQLCRMLAIKDQQMSHLVRQVLTWAAFQEEALSLTELDTAVALSKAMRKRPGQIITDKELADCLEEGLRAKVNFYCGPLVNLSDGHLSPLHQSVKTRIANHLNSSSQDDPQGLLASICTMYLSMAGAVETLCDNSSETTSSWESKVRKTMKERPFMRYASLYWHKHFHQAAKNDPDTEERKKKLTQEGDEHAKSWTEVWWFMARGSAPKQEFPDKDFRLADKIVGSWSRNQDSLESDDQVSLPRDPSVQMEPATGGGTLAQGRDTFRQPGNSVIVRNAALEASMPKIVTVVKEFVEVEKEGVKVVEVVREVEKEVVKEIVKEVEVEVVKEAEIVQEIKVVQEVEVLVREVANMTPKVRLITVDRNVTQYVLIPPEKLEVQTINIIQPDSKKRQRLSYFKNLGKAMRDVGKAMRGKGQNDSD